MWLIIVESIVVPFEVAFSGETSTESPFGYISTTVWVHATQAIFILDVLHNFFVPYADQSDGSNVFDFRKISAHYIFSAWFLVDFFACIPFEYFSDDGDSPQSDMVHKMKLLKVIRMARLGRAATRRTDENFKHSVQIIKLVWVFVITIHWTACAWNMIGNEWRCHDANVDMFGSFEETDDREAELTGVISDGACETSLIGVYTACLYQACRSLCGDGEAYTHAEQIVFTIIVVIGAIVQASVFGSVANLVRSFDADTRTFEHKLDHVRYKMAFLRVPDNLQDRVVAYYENLWLHHKSLGETSATAFVSELSRPLQMELKLNLFKEMLLRIPFLQAVDTAVAEELVLRLESQLYMTGDMVIRKGDPGDWMGFVSQG